MSKPVIFGDPSSIFVRAILIALTEKGVIYGLAAESEQPRHRFCERVPDETAIEHDGFLVRGAESILRYVDEALPGPRLQPEAPRQGTRMNRALEIYFREAVPVLGGQILMRTLASAFTDEWISPTLPESVASAARQTVGRLSQVLDDGPFLAGDMFTLADAAVAPLFDYLMPLPEAEALFPPTSPLRSWWQHMAQRDSVWSTRPRNGLCAMLLPGV
jgi:glutathione S-transferase